LRQCPWAPAPSPRALPEEGAKGVGVIFTPAGSALLPRLRLLPSRPAHLLLLLLLLPLLLPPLPPPLLLLLLSL
jgi:hypothetical protein